MTEKRGRGRPKDASIHRDPDHARLARMAALIAVAPELKPDSAMARIGVHDESAKRRLRRRWKRYGADHLAQARQDLQVRPPRTGDESLTVIMVRRMRPSIRERYAQLGDAVRMMDQHRALGDLHKLGVLLATPSLISPEVAKQVAASKSAWDSPAMRRIGAELSASEPLRKALEQVKIGEVWRQISKTVV